MIYTYNAYGQAWVPPPLHLPPPQEEPDTQAIRGQFVLYKSFKSYPLGEG